MTVVGLLFGGDGDVKFNAASAPPGASVGRDDEGGCCRITGNTPPIITFLFLLFFLLFLLVKWFL
jgi:hypothetical protein